MSEINQLAARAAHYQTIILDVAYGPGGLLASFVRYDTRRPFQEGEADHPYLTSHLDGVWGGNTPKPTIADWLYGENTLWATGWLLWSQILRYRATQEPAALTIARKCFADLNHLFALSGQIEPGLLGKPHGGRPGATTSFDQAASPVLFYAIYAQELATPAERATAAANLAAHGDYYLRRNWVMNHHGHLTRIVDPAHTSSMKYLACLHAAYDVTGETRFRDAALRYLRQINAAGRLPWPTNPYELNHNAYYYALLADYWSRSALANEIDWIGHIGHYWRAMQLSFDGEGIYRFGSYDATNHTFTPYPNQWVDRSGADRLGVTDPSQNARRWVSATSLSNRALTAGMSAALGMLAQAHGLDRDAHRAARRILLRLDEDKMRWWWDDGTLPDELKPLLNIFGPEVPAVWLVAYWHGRLLGAW